MVALTQQQASNLATYAKMSLHSYTNWGRQENSANNHISEIGLGSNWSYNGASSTPSSGFFAESFVSSSNEVVVVIRGTDSIIDGITDIQFLLDFYPNQFYDAVRYVWEIAENRDIDPADIVFSGHSLGGGWPDCWPKSLGRPLTLFRLRRTMALRQCI